MLSDSIRTGTYDANACMLRTCSLPNLTSLLPYANDQAEKGGHDKEVESEHCGGSREDSVCGGGDDDKEVEGVGIKSDDGSSGCREGSGSGRDGEGSAKVANSDESREEQEGVKEKERVEVKEEEPDEEEEDWSSSEDEDLQQLVKTLQNFVEEGSGL